VVLITARGGEEKPKGKTKLGRGGKKKKKKRDWGEVGSSLSYYRHVASKTGRKGETKNSTIKRVGWKTHPIAPWDGCTCEGLVKKKGEW